MVLVLDIATPDTVTRKCREFIKVNGEKIHTTKEKGLHARESNKREYLHRFHKTSNYNLLIVMQMDDYDIKFTLIERKLQLD